MMGTEESALCRESFDMFSKMRDDCEGKEIQLPQMCVVGDQSSGKSSLLQSLTNVAFSVNSQLCTRAPIVVESRSGDHERCQFRACPSAEFRDIDVGDISGEIVKAQGALLSTSGDTELKISEEEITLRVYGPERIDLVMVDLPGIIHNGDSSEATIKLIDKYIKPEQTLILLISEAKQNEELNKAAELAKQHDPEGKRTLRILTKFDTFDSKEARKHAIDRIVQESSCSLGAHAVICLPGGEAPSKSFMQLIAGNRLNGGDVTPTEDEAFSKMKTPTEDMLGLPSSRHGVLSLAKRLPALYANLIETNLPRIIQDASTKLSLYTTELNNLGPVLTGTQMIIKLQRALQCDQGKSSFQARVAPFIENFRKEVEDTGSQITEEWVKDLMVPDAFPTAGPFFQGGKDYLRCINQIVDCWQTSTRCLLVEVKKLLMDPSMTSAVTVGVSEMLYSAVTVRWSAHAAHLADELEHKYDDILEQYRQPGTINPDLMHGCNCPVQLLEADLQEELVRTSAKGVVELDVASFVSCANTLLGKHNDPKLAVVNHILVAVKQMWKIERRGFVDSIYKKTRSGVFDGYTQWLQTALLADPEITESAKEDNDTAGSRKRLEQKIQTNQKVKAQATCMVVNRNNRDSQSQIKAKL